MDIIKTIRDESEMWELFTRKEEYNPPFLDQYGRFPYYLSGYRDFMNPAVSSYLNEHGYRTYYPEGKKFAVCLTHDIDSIQAGFKSCMFNSAVTTLKGDIKSTSDNISYILNKKRYPDWNFKEIMELENKYDAKSSFYFLALRAGEKDHNYDIEDVADEIRFISDRGWEVGLHGGHQSYNNLEDLLEKKKRLEDVLGKEVIGYRNHFLRFKTPETWELLSQAGFKYDTTFGYADCVGFRNGMCHPFRPYNRNTDRQIEILEIPLVIMDCTMLRDYMRLNISDSWDITKKLIDTVEKYGGVITILWHNTYMKGEFLEFYEKILKYSYEKNAWITSGEEIYKWWSETEHSFGPA